MRVASFAVMLAALAGCASTPPPQQAVSTPQRAPGPPPPSVNGDWSLVNFRDAGPNDAIGATLRLDGAAAKGQVSCQQFTATTRQYGMDMRFENVSAPAGCAVSPVDAKFMQALNDIRGVTIRSGYLVLSDSTGRERLYFKRET